MGVTPITSLRQFHQVIESSQPVVIDFWASWCRPCKLMSPIFENYSKDGGIFNDIGFYSVDTDEQIDIAEEVGIRAMPTFYVFQSGEKTGVLVGADPTGLEKLLMKQLNRYPSARM